LTTVVPVFGGHNINATATIPWLLAPFTISLQLWNSLLGRLQKLASPVLAVSDFSISNVIIVSLIHAEAEKVKFIVKDANMTAKHAIRQYIILPDLSPALVSCRGERDAVLDGKVIVRVGLLFIWEAPLVSAIGTNKDGATTDGRFAKVVVVRPEIISRIAIGTLNGTNIAHAAVMFGIVSSIVALPCIGESAAD
jgi:hypothetical protein